MVVVASLVLIPAQAFAENYGDTGTGTIITGPGEAGLGGTTFLTAPGGPANPGSSGATYTPPADCTGETGTVVGLTITVTVACSSGSDLGNYGECTTSSVNCACVSAGEFGTACVGQFTSTINPGVGGVDPANALSQAQALLPVPIPYYVGNVPGPPTPYWQGSPGWGSGPGQHPYAYANYPTQVSIGNLAAQLPEVYKSPPCVPATQTLQDGSTVTYSVCTTAAVWAVLANYTWTTQDAIANTVSCGAGQNQLSLTWDNKVASPNYCTVDYTQRSDLTGFPITGIGTYDYYGWVKNTVCTPQCTTFTTADYIATPFAQVNTAPVTANIPVGGLESILCTQGMNGC